MIKEITPHVPFLPFLRVYSLTFLLGIITMWETTKHNLWLKGYSIDNKRFDDFVVYCILGGILGARLWFVFSDLGYYLSNPLKIFMIWEGGIAVQGAIIGVALTAKYLKYKMNIKPPMLEITAASLPIVFLAQPIGRWGNFYNQEIYGKILEKATVTTLVYSLTALQILLISSIIFYIKPWKKIKTATRTIYYKLMIGVLVLLGLHAINLFALGYVPRMVEHMNINGGYRLPLFLVEGTISIIIFIMLYISKIKTPHNKIAYTLITFGLLRAILEPMRNQADIMKIGPIYISVILSIIYVLFGLFIIYKGKQNGK